MTSGFQFKDRNYKLSVISPYNLIEHVHHMYMFIMLQLMLQLID